MTTVRAIFTNPNIIIKTVDKEGFTTIMSTTNYIKKGERQLIKLTTMKLWTPTQDLSNKSNT